VAESDPGGLRPMRPIHRFPFEEEVLPLLDEAVSYLPHAAPPAAGAAPGRVVLPQDPIKPCAGFGLNAAANATEFAQGFKRLEQQWRHMSRDQRLNGLEALAMQQYRKFQPAMPIVNAVVGDDTGGEGGAYFDPASWTMTFWRATLDNNHPSASELSNLADAVYHESRHAEQWFLMARWYSTNTPTFGPDARDQGIAAFRMGSNLQIPPSVANLARQLPLAKGAPQEQCASLLYDQVYGKGKDQNVATENGLVQAETEDQAAQNYYDTVSNERPTNVKKINAAGAALQQANNRYNAAYAAYAKLTEEADALATGDMIPPLLNSMK